MWISNFQAVLINFVACETGLTDRSRIKRLLSDHNYDAAEVIELCNGGASHQREDESSVNGVEKGSEDDAKEIESKRPQPTKPKLSRPETARSRVKSTKDKQKEKREVKKARQAERNRRKLVGDEENEEDYVHVLTSEIQCLDL